MTQYLNNRKEIIGEVRFQLLVNIYDKMYFERRLLQFAISNNGQIKEAYLNSLLRYKAST